MKILDKNFFIETISMEISTKLDNFFSFKENNFYPPYPSQTRNKIKKQTHQWHFYLKMWKNIEASFQYSVKTLKKFRKYISSPNKGIG